jgi:hypothetical protein
MIRAAQCGAMVALLASCAAPGGSGRQQVTFEHATASQRAYVDCAEHWGAEYIGTKASASEVAIAAQARCERQLSDYERTARAHFLTVTEGRNQPLAVQRARELAAGLREKVHGHLVRLVIATRADK